MRGTLTFLMSCGLSAVSVASDAVSRTAASAWRQRRLHLPAPVLIALIAVGLWLLTPIGDRAVFADCDGPCPSNVGASISVEPAEVGVGDAFEVSATVTALRYAVVNVQPSSPLEITGDGGAEVLSGPEPASVAVLAAGESATFRYTLEATGPGEVVITAAFQNPPDALPVRPRAAVTITGSLTASVSTSPSEVDVEEQFAVTVLARNGTGHDLDSVRPSGELAMDGSGRADVLSGPVPSSVPALLAGESVSFTYVLQAREPGEIGFVLQIAADGGITAIAAPKDCAPEGDPCPGTVRVLGLKVEVAVQEAPVAVNEGYHAFLRVTNVLGKTITGVVPPDGLEHTDGAEEVGGPHPAFLQSLGPGETFDFIYGFRALNEGETAFGAEVTARVGGRAISGSATLACVAQPSVIVSGEFTFCRNIAEVTGTRVHLISFYTQTGHAWVVLQPRSGPQAGQRISIGRYPSDTNIFNTEANLTFDRAVWLYRLTIAVTADQYNAVASYLNVQLNPDTRTRYRFLSTNCMSFLGEVAGEAGVELPAFTTFGVPDPTKFHGSLESIYNTQGAVSPSGGIVERNPAVGNRGELSAVGDEPPQRCSYSEIADGALAGQAALAKALSLEFHKEGLPVAKISTSDACTITLSNTDAESAILLFDFGDGSDVRHQSADVEHTYAEAGIYHGRVITVDSGAVREWTFDVEVGAAGGGCDQNIEVPDPPPAGWTTGPYEEPPIVALVRAALSGDLDCDGNVDSVDALRVLRHSAGMASNAKCLADAGDVDCDGDIDTVDALNILRHVAGLPVNLPQGCRQIAGGSRMADPSDADKANGSPNVRGILRSITAR